MCQDIALATRAGRVAALMILQFAMRHCCRGTPLLDNWDFDFLDVFTDSTESNFPTLSPLKTRTTMGHPFR
jgi:hypothetical protein